MGSKTLVCGLTRHLHNLLITDSQCQLIGPFWITEQLNLQRHWCHPRSPHPLLGKADREACHQKGQISLSQHRQISSKSSYLKSLFSSWEMHFQSQNTYFMCLKNNLTLWKRLKWDCRWGFVMLTAEANQKLVRGWLKDSHGCNVNQNFNSKKKKIQHIDLLWGTSTGSTVFFQSLTSSLAVSIFFNRCGCQAWKMQQTCVLYEAPHFHASHTRHSSPQLPTLALIAAAGSVASIAAGESLQAFLTLIVLCKRSNSLDNKTEVGTSRGLSWE